MTNQDVLQALGGILSAFLAFYFIVRPLANSFSEVGVVETFERMVETFRSLEVWLFEGVALVVPWAAPMLPAALTFGHVAETLGMGVFIASWAAVTVEGLGITTISTGLAFWYHNQTSSEDDKIPTGALLLVGATFLAYVSIIVSVNVLLEVWPAAKGARVVVVALLTLQTIPAALIIAMRNQYKNISEAVTTGKDEAAYKRKLDSLKRRSLISDDEYVSRILGEGSRRLTREEAQQERPAPAREPERESLIKSHSWHTLPANIKVRLAEVAVDGEQSRLLLTNGPMSETERKSLANWRNYAERDYPTVYSGQETPAEYFARLSH